MMGCSDSAGDSRWYLPRCAVKGCTWDVNHEGDKCWQHRNTTVEGDTHV
mgnify:CR=1 FL=1